MSKKSDFTIFKEMDNMPGHAKPIRSSCFLENSQNRK